jgi:hypothetical protein
MVSTHYSGLTDGFKEKVLLKLLHCSLLLSHKGRDKNEPCRKPLMAMRGHLTYMEPSPWESLSNILVGNPTRCCCGGIV